MNCQTSIVNDTGYIKPPRHPCSEEVWDSVSDALEELYAQGKTTVVLDLADIEMIDSHAVAGIILCYRFLKAEGGTLKVKVKGCAKEALEMLMLDRILSVEE